MTSELMASALATFHAAAVGGSQPLDAQSGAWTRRVRTALGDPAYLKITAAAPRSNALVAAVRELRFYRKRAPTAPVRTPPLLRAFRDEHGIALLLGDAGVQLDATAWRREHWRTLGGELARLHTMPIHPEDRSRQDGLLAAIRDPDLGQVQGFWWGLPGLERLLAARDRLYERLASEPAVLVHGDCHTSNIVHDGSSLVFCDWQSTGAGRASSDLALLSVRSTPTGAVVPEILFEEYCRQAVPSRDPTEVVEAVLLEELAILVFLWPPFASLNSAPGIARVHSRAHHLMHRTEISWLTD